MRDMIFNQTLTPVVPVAGLHIIELPYDAVRHYGQSR
jgi:hypothetical protein